MKVAIMSDSHDNIWNLEKALTKIKEAQVEIIIHCGDLVAPFVLKQLSQYEGEIHFVFGNNDGEKYLLTKLCYEELHNAHCHGAWGKIDMSELTIAFTHYPEMAYGISKNADIVCFGHTHLYELKDIEGTTYLNPGEIMGKEGNPSFCIIDTYQKKIDKVSI